MKEDTDIYNQATSEEQDKIYNLVSNLPGEFFRDDIGWIATLKELHELVVDIEARQSR